MDFQGKILANRYELLERVGGGGMAVVYKAKCHLLNRFVAVKILRKEFVEDEDFIKRFRIEAQSSASLSHPNIVSVYDVGEEDGINYIVMEYVEGQTLKDYITKEGKLPWRKAVNIALQICSALETAHKNNIIHRDIKPHNIILTNEMIVKVTDFGIAKAVTGSTLTAFGNTIGSVHYFSPEHARGGATDAKSDLYSLGIVLYEMLTGRVPFDGETPVAIAFKHVQESPIPPIDLVSDIPMSINKIVLKSIQKDQANRYASATEMMRDLNRSITDQSGEYIILNETDINATQNIPIIDENFLNGFGGTNIESSTINDSKKDIKTKKYAEKKPVTKKTIIVFSSILIGVMLLFGFIGWAIFTSSVPELEVPNLIGMPITTAESLAAEMKVKIEVSGTEPSSTVPKDYIISQDPEQPMKIRENGTVKVILSSGTEKVKVPDVVNKEYRGAESTLYNAGLKYVENFEESTTMPYDYIIRQYPPAGYEVDANSEIQIYISKEPEKTTVTVPNVTGKSESEAKKLLEENNLVVKTKTVQDSSKDNDVVISQDVAANTVVASGSVVTISINKVEKIAETKKISINLSEKLTTDSATIKVVLQSTNSKDKVVYEKVHKKTDGTISIPVSLENGSGTIKVYADGNLIQEE